MLRRVVKAVGKRAGLLAPNTHTELSIPVTCTAALAESWRRSAGGFIRPDHVTLLDPFVPSPALDLAVEEEVGRVVQTFCSFTYDLVRLDRFPGVLYLAPEPSEFFVALTEALWRAFPDYPPFGGAYDSIVPHVTLAMGEEPPGLAVHVLERLPLQGRVSEVWLMAETRNGGWGPRRRFPLR